ncbi:helix-turn-helix domain-containing protein [Janthinobacterium rivuli]|uniref:Crp/Fnr family transcriptional regulator n=1 Tax=Janthinobacterium sp. FT68W TaxID=2654255 RepID=UPI0012647384|nr:Crp/Fnr family transcriptional regulator [Janthinobacterium sp. FT68W]KAB8048712.1 helix-turn-helix domain-containing protein [Janthinobacterium sp. FT68W]
MYDTSSYGSEAASPLPCGECGSRGVCLPTGMSDADCARVSGLVLQQHHLARGDTLQGINESVHGRWYAIRSGQFKSFQADPHGRPCITRFARKGDLLGLDSLDLDHYTDSTTALCDSTVCEFSYPQLIEAARHFPDLARVLECRLSKQLAQQQALALLVRCDYAEQKFAQFLSHQDWNDIDQAHQVPELHLALSRKEIADYLDLTHATVTRMLSRLQKLGIISVRYRQLRLLDGPGLLQIAAGQPPSSKGGAGTTMPGIHLLPPE